MSRTRRDSGAITEAVQTTVARETRRVLREREDDLAALVRAEE